MTLMESVFCFCFVAVVLFIFKGITVTFFFSLHIADTLRPVLNFSPTDLFSPFEKISDLIVLIESEKEKRQEVNDRQTIKS